MPWQLQRGNSMRSGAGYMYWHAIGVLHHRCVSGAVALCVAVVVLLHTSAYVLVLCLEPLLPGGWVPFCHAWLNMQFE